MMKMMMRRRKKNKEENPNPEHPLNKFWQDSQEQTMSLSGFWREGGTALKVLSEKFLKTLRRSNRREVLVLVPCVCTLHRWFRAAVEPALGEARVTRFCRGL